jgi:hypothetical protein
MKHYVQKQEEWIIRIALLLYIAGNLICAFGCSSTTSNQYPYHGPLVDPDGKLPPEPHYETIQK